MVETLSVDLQQTHKREVKIKIVEYLEVLKVKEEGGDAKGKNQKKSVDRE